MTTTASTVAVPSLSREEQVRIRKMTPNQRCYNDAARYFAGETTLDECITCDDGMAELIAEDCSPETGACYVAVNGSHYESLEAFCAQCVAAGLHIWEGPVS